MPVPSIFYLLEHGPPQWSRDHARELLLTVAAVTLLVLLKRFTSGAANAAEQPLHGKVVLLTGGTSGVGAQVARELASRGAQLVLLTQAPGSDPFLAEFVQDLRDSTGNNLVYAEQVDLASLHSVRRFATRWIDNAPPRRLDMVVLCAATLTPPGGRRRVTPEGIEETWMVNFLANFHLLGLLSPAIKAQPIDRDVRVIMATCSSYIASPSLKLGLGGNGDAAADKKEEEEEKKGWTPGAAYARSKLALNVFGQAFQKHLDAYERPDKFPMRAKVVLVDPGLSRTPGMRRWLTRGSLLGLLLYLCFYAVPWFLLKSPHRAAQSILHAAMDGGLGRGRGGRLVKECREVDFARKEVTDEAVAKTLWEESDALIERTETAMAKKRAAAKAAEGRHAEEEKQREQLDEVEGLVAAIKKGKQRAKEKEKEKEKKKAKREKKQK